MFRRSWLPIVTIAVLTLAAPARAAVIVIDVDYVDSNGLAWADLTDTLNLTWDQVDAICANDGVTACSGSINDIDFTGWVWATHDQVRDLFVEATDLTAAQMADYDEEGISTTWAPQFFAKFAVTFSSGNGWMYVNGWSADATLAPTYAFTPVMNSFHDVNDPIGYTEDEALADDTWFRDRRDPNLGVWLFRPVPEPGTLALFAAGLVGVRLIRRRR